MGFHTFDTDEAERLEQPGTRYRWVSAEEVVEPFLSSSIEVVADLGSGTGFYTDDVAPYVETLYGVDLQPEMHEFYRQKGVPTNVELVDSDIVSLPFADDELDGAFSTMTFHEFGTPAAIDELARVIETDGVLSVFDWSADGNGDGGPPRTERYGIHDAEAMLTDAGFAVSSAVQRTETLAIEARAP